MSLHHYFAIFLFVINVAAATVDSIRNLQQAPTVPYPVDFKLPPININELTDKSYQDFITSLIAKAKGKEALGNVPILPPEGNHLFDVVVQVTEGKDTHEVTVRFRRNNLYVRGYRMETSMKTNTWMELREDKDDKLHMVDTNSEHLRFFGSYNDLVSVANRPVTKINFAKESLKGAVTALFKSTSNDADRARFLIFMAQMISEAARFKDVSKFFGTNIDKEKYVSQDLHNLQNNWSKYSTAVQCYDKYLTGYNFTPVTILGRPYNTAWELRTIFGIMLKETKISIPKTCGIKKLAVGDEGEVAVILSAEM